MRLGPCPVFYDIVYAVYVEHVALSREKERIRGGEEEGGLKVGSKRFKNGG